MFVEIALGSSGYEVELWVVVEKKLLMIEIIQNHNCDWLASDS